MIYIGSGPLPRTQTTRVTKCLVGVSYKPSFATGTGRGPRPNLQSFPTPIAYLLRWGLAKSWNGSVLRYFRFQLKSHLQQKNSTQLVFRYIIYSHYIDWLILLKYPLKHSDFRSTPPKKWPPFCDSLRSTWEDLVSIDHLVPLDPKNAPLVGGWKPNPYIFKTCI